MTHGFEVDILIAARRAFVRAVKQKIVEVIEHLLKQFLQMLGGGGLELFAKRRCVHSTRCFGSERDNFAAAVHKFLSIFQRRNTAVKRNNPNFFQ